MALTSFALLEAVLFSAGEAIEKETLKKLLALSAKELAEAAEELRTTLANSGLSLMETNIKYELRTAADAADILKEYRESELSRDIGKASLEALAVILYRESATRSEIDWVRGVNSAAALRTLTIRGLIERFEDPDDKRKIRYRATVDALAHLGVANREDLPRFAEFTKTLAEQEEALLATQSV